MELKIRNFAKIKDANIIIDGITVIAGENNTGKSTIGKILFSLFNSLSSIEEKILLERLKAIESTSRDIIRSSYSDIGLPGMVASRAALNATKKFSAHLKAEIESISDETLSTLVEDAIKSSMPVSKTTHHDVLADTVKKVCINVKELLNLPEKTIGLEIISRYFDSVFHSQIIPLSTDGEVDSELTLNIRGNDILISFKNNYCEEFIDNVKLLHKAIYIDTPFVIDELSSFRYPTANPTSNFLLDLLVSKSQNDVLDGVIESVRAKEKLNDIYTTLQCAVDGDILINQSNDEYYLKNNEFTEPISFHNLSTGMKSFLILKMLLEKGCLNNKDVVVLDEPEIHLHPQWQIVYAELIVLLQKHFDLSVVVTTHSPYFVDALNLFSYKHEVNDKVNYYLSTASSNSVSMQCVTDNIDQIYKKMASPIQILDTLRYELDND